MVLERGTIVLGAIKAGAMVLISSLFDTCFGKLDQGDIYDSCWYKRFCEEYYENGGLWK